MKRTTSAGRVEFAGIASGIAHLAEHRLVERAQRVQLVAGGEMDAANLVNDIAQQVARSHAVIDALEIRWRSRRDGRRRLSL